MTYDICIEREGLTHTHNIHNIHIHIIYTLQVNSLASGNRAMMLLEGKAGAYIR
jgi:hypothetical protein